MTHATGIARRIGIGLVVLTLTLGGFLVQPAGALAGFSTSPGPSSHSLACGSGDHTKDVKLV